jgi:hypothetical protein
MNEPGVCSVFGDLRFYGKPAVNKERIASLYPLFGSAELQLCFVGA